MRKIVRDIGRSLGYLSGADQVAKVAGVYGDRTRSFGFISQAFRKLRGGDGFEPASDDARDRFEEARRHYGVSDADLRDRIRGSHDQAVIYGLLAAIGTAGAAFASSGYGTTVGACFAVVCALYVLKAAVANHVFRTGRTTTLSAFFRSGDIMPRRA